MHANNGLWRRGLCVLLVLALSCKAVVPPTFADTEPEVPSGLKAPTAELVSTAPASGGSSGVAPEVPEAIPGDPEPATEELEAPVDPESTVSAPAPKEPAAADQASEESAASNPASEDSVAAEPSTPAPLAMANGEAYVGNFSELESALANPDVRLIKVHGDIQKPWNGEKWFDLKHSVEIQGVGGTTSTLRFIWFDVGPGVTLKLSGDLAFDCNRAAGSLYESINVIKVKGGGSLEVSGNVSLSTDNGRGDYRYLGYGVYVEAGGRADIRTAGTVRGSCGAVYVASGGAATISGEGHYRSENATGHDDSGNVGLNQGEGRMPVENDGSLMVYGNPRIEGIGTNVGGVSAILGGVYQNTGAEQNTNPSFVNNGKVYLTKCRIGKGPNKSRNLIFNEGSHTLILSSGTDAVDIEGFKLDVGAPAVSYDDDAHALKVDGAFTGGVQDVSERTGLYQTNTGFSSLKELVEHKDENFQRIEDSVFDLGAGTVAAREEPGVPSMTLPYVFTMIDLADGHNFGGQTDVLNNGGMIWIFGPTAPLSQVSVDVAWGPMDHVVMGTWNPETHRYEGQDLSEATPGASGVTVSLARESTRPTAASFGFEIAEPFARQVAGSFDGGGAAAVVRPGETAHRSLKLELREGAQLPYFSGAQTAGRATVSIGFAS